MTAPRASWMLLACVVSGCGGRAVEEPVRPIASQEERLLAQLKEEKVRELEGRLREVSGEQKMAVLLQLADVASARAFEIVDRNIDSVSDRPTLLNAVASKGSADARPLLRRAVDSWGPDAAHPIERLHFVYGREIAPDLRKRLAADPGDAVGRAIRRELVRLKDPQALAELRGEIAGLAAGSRDDAELAIAVLSEATDCVEVAAEVGRLFRRVDERRSDAHRQLKQYAAGVALWLGDQASAEHVIELLASPGSDYFGYPGLFSLTDILKRQTKQSFTSPAEWKAWWKSTGRGMPLFTVHVSPDDEAMIVNAVVSWGRSAEAGPVIRGGITYLQLDSRTYRDRQEIRAGLDADIHAYRPAEIALLGKTAYSVQEIESNGRTACAILGDGSNGFKWRMTRLGLRKEGGRWRVVGQDTTESGS